MRPSMLVGEALSAIASRVAHTAPGEVGGWIVTLTSLLVLLAVGGAAARVASQLTHGSRPELMVLLNQSAAFYRRWPEDQHGNAPSGELAAEAIRCRRIIELLELRAPQGTVRDPASRGPIDGLYSWIAVLQKQIQSRDSAPSGAVHA